MTHYDAFGILRFKNITETEMTNIRGMLDHYFLKHKVHNIGDNNNFGEYVINSEVDFYTVKTAIRYLYDNHFDKVRYMSILWRESENINDNDTTFFSHVKQVKLESHPFDNPTEIIFKEDISTITHNSGIIWGS